MMSNNTRSGFSSMARFRPASPSAAVSTRWPSVSRQSFSAVRMGSSSSMINTRDIIHNYFGLKPLTLGGASESLTVEGILASSPSPPRSGREGRGEEVLLIGLGAQRCSRSPSLSASAWLRRDKQLSLRVPCGARERSEARSNCFAFPLKLLAHSFSSLAHGQFDREAGCLAGRAANGHPSAVRLHNMFHNAQSFDAHALRFPAQL